MCIGLEAPALLCQESLVESLEIAKPQAAIFFGRAHFIPTQPSYFVPTFLLTPSKISDHTCHPITEGVRKFKNTHCIGGDGLCYGLNEYFFPSL